MNKTITLLNGVITINKAKFDRLLSMISYALLYVVRIFLLISGSIFSFLTIISAGDTRMNDNNPQAMYLSFVIAITCFLCVAFVNTIMKNIVKNYKARCQKRKLLTATASTEVI